MTWSATLTAWLLGLILGMRHALEPDHLAAMSTLLTTRATLPPRRAAMTGALWGVGHTTSLVVVGGAVLVMRTSVDAAVWPALELAVAAMLLVMGARSLLRAFRLGRQSLDAPVAHAHRHHVHSHSGPEEHLHLGRWTVARKPFVVGVLHGLAGSGSLTALALAAMPSVRGGLVYLLLFGIGSIVAMAALAGLAGWPLQLLSRRTGMQATLGAAAGVLAVSLGMFWGIDAGRALLGR